MFPSSCLNYFSVSADSILCWENIFDLNLSRFSIVFRKSFLYSLLVEKYFRCLNVLPSCVMSLAIDSKSFMVKKFLQ